jgi:hypothetical protein
VAYGKLQIEAGFDLADIGGIELDVVETGGNAFTTTITSGTYFLRTDASSATGDHTASVTGYGSLLAAITADFNAQGAGSLTYTSGFDLSPDKVTFSHSGGGGVTNVQITPVTNGGLLGLTGALSGLSALIAHRPPDYYVDGDVGYWAEWREREVEADAMVDVVAHDGTPHGLAPEGVETHLDFVVPMEPRAKVYTRHASASQPWTWRDTFRHVRNVLPLAVYDGEETHLVRLRREGAAFAPRSVTRDYVGHYDIPIRARLLGRL